MVFQNEKHRKLNVNIQQLLNEKYIDIEEKVSYKISLIEIDYTSFNPKDFPKIIKEIDLIIDFLSEEKIKAPDFDISIAKKIIWTYIGKYAVVDQPIAFFFDPFSC